MINYRADIIFVRQTMYFFHVKLFTLCELVRGKRCVGFSGLNIGFVVTEDGQKDKKEAMLKRLRGEDEGIARAMVVKMIEDSMRIFWEFVHADKEEVARGLWVDPNKVHKDSSDAKLLSEIRLELHKVIYNIPIFYLLALIRETLIWVYHRILT